MATTNWLPVLALLLIASVSACARRDEHTSTSAATASAPLKHEHKAPHAGTAVVLGQESYHLELVRDAMEGKLTAYVLDGEMENFIRVKAAEFEIVAVIDGAKRPLAFKAVANTATGETVGDTAQFEAQADWLKTTATFDGMLTSLAIRGSNFTGVAFNFPKGNDKD
jgi:hypothetical protein